MVVDPSGPACPCGKRGCWERYASGSGLAWLAREAAAAGAAGRVLELAGGALGDVRGEHVTTAAAEGDADALAVVDRFAWWLGLGLANLAAVLDPELHAANACEPSRSKNAISAKPTVCNAVMISPLCRGSLSKRL